KCLLQRSVDRFGDRPALGPVEGEAMTYAEFGRKIRELTEFLGEQGIVAGDRVAILSENQPNWGVAYFAITTMGAIAVPIFPEFVTNAIQHILRHAGCKAIFVSNRLMNKLQDCQTEALNTRLIIDDFSLLPSETKMDRLKEAVRERTKEFMALTEAALRLGGRSQEEVEEDDIALIIYTSGTTGHSKGVILTHKNIVFDAQATTSMVHVTEEDRLLSILPLSHTYESTVGLVCPVMLGASIYYLDKPPSARVLMSAMAQVKPTIMLSVPLVIEKVYKMRILPELEKNVFRRLLCKIPPVRVQLHRIAGKKLLAAFGGNLRLLAIGGAALSPDVETWLCEARFPYTVGYGLTETAPVVAGAPPETAKCRSTGPALRGVEVKIVDPHPQTGEGEILVRGPNVMQGYYKDPERTADVFTGDGWFRTGDLGLFDEDQYLYIKGRLKNVIIGPSGENIYPEEIEAVINRSDYVLESLVFQPQGGQLMARVYLNYEKLETEAISQKLSESQMGKRIQELLEELRVQVNAAVPGFARVNKILEQTEPFEKTPTQKVKRFLYVN
ncbi:MAG: AMP-binding protein, partial [Chloroflexota bacterium]